MKQQIEKSGSLETEVWLSLTSGLLPMQSTLLELMNQPSPSASGKTDS